MNKLIHWLPRIITILAICFVSLFALDSFDDRLSIGEQIQAFLIHTIPSMVLIVLLVIAWRYKLTGGIIITIAGIIMGIWIFDMNLHRTQNMMIALTIVASIALPFILSGILFILDHRNIKRSSH